MLITKVEWHPAGWPVCLRLLIFPFTKKSRSSLLTPAHPGGPGKRGRKMVVVTILIYLQLMFFDKFFIESDNGVLVLHMKGRFCSFVLL